MDLRKLNTPLGVCAPIRADFRMLFPRHSRKIVILRACDFIDLLSETLDLKQKRHPESSAAQIYYVIERR